MDTTVKIFVTNSAVEERDRNLQVSIGCLLCARASHCAKKQLGINPVQPVVRRSAGDRPEIYTPLGAVRIQGCEQTK